MKKVLVLALAIYAQMTFADGVQYANSVVLPLSANQIKLVDARYMMIPTRSEVQPIPGCVPNSEVGADCTQTVVTESEPAIVANITYMDSAYNPGDGQIPMNAGVTFRTSDFSSADVAMLQAAYPQYRHPFTRAPARFAKDKLMLTVEKVKQTFQMIDASRSTLCQPNEAGQIVPGCVEHLVYKDATRTVLVANRHHQVVRGCCFRSPDCILWL